MRKLVLALAVLVIFGGNVLAKDNHTRPPSNKSHTILDQYGREAGSFKRDNVGSIQFKDRFGRDDGSITKTGVIKDRFGREIGKVK